MGVKTLMKEISEEEVKINIKKILKKQEKNTELSQIYRLFVTVSGEILKNVYEIFRVNKPKDDMMKEIEKITSLIEYCNESLTVLSNKFKNNVKHIEEIKF
jgi:hypothetical protein